MEAAASLAAELRTAAQTAPAAEAAEASADVGYVGDDERRAPSTPPTPRRKQRLTGMLFSIASPARASTPPSHEPGARSGGRSPPPRRRSILSGGHTSAADRAHYDADCTVAADDAALAV